MEKSDLIIIGAGPGGYETAVEAVALGKSVTLIERDKFGGHVSTVVVFRRRLYAVPPKSPLILQKPVTMVSLRQLHRSIFRQSCSVKTGL